MTVQPTRDALPPVAVARASCRYYIQHGAGYEPSTWEVAAILDALDRAEAEVKRLSWKCGHLADKYAQDTEELRQEVAQAETELDSWMTRAYEAEQRAWRAEARIKAVRDVLDEAILRDGTEEQELARRIRRALDN